MEATQTLEFKGLKRRPTSTYMHTSAAPKEAPKKKNQRGLEALPKEIKKYNISGKIVFGVFYILCLALFIGSILVYINWQGKLSNSVDKIASLQAQYETCKKENDAKYAEINSSVDYEEIRRVAIEELGMHYASEGQIVTYTDNEANDFVRTIKPID